MNREGPKTDGMLTGPTTITVPASAIMLIDLVTLKVREARTVNEQLQRQHATGSPFWQQCARVDDLLFEALNALGE